MSEILPTETAKEPRENTSIRDPRNKEELDAVIDGILKKQEEQKDSDEEHPPHPFPQYILRRICLTKASRDSTEAWAAAEHNAVSIGNVMRCNLCDLAAVLYNKGFLDNPYDVEQHTLITAPAFDGHGKNIKDHMEVFVPKNIVKTQPASTAHTPSEQQ